MKQLIIGPPGTGKTTHLINLVKEKMFQGIDPSDILYLAFTRKAANEARSRIAMELNEPENSFDTFRTIHSLCFKELGLTTKSMMMRHHYKEVLDICSIDDEGILIDNATGVVGEQSKIPFLENLARVKQLPLNYVWQAYSEEISLLELNEYSEELIKFKNSRGLRDFTDILQEFIAIEKTYPRVLIIDEGQDLSPLQWQVVNSLAIGAEEVYVAGDDDQAIYRWAGADISAFETFSEDVKILNQSYRIPRTVHDLSQSLIARISGRRRKPFNPTSHNGSVNFVDSHEELNLDEGTWYLIARNNFSLRALEEYCHECGYLFTSSASLGDKYKDIVEAIRAWKALCNNDQVTVGRIREIYKLTTTVDRGHKTGKTLPEDDRVLLNLKDLSQFGFTSTPCEWSTLLDKISLDDISYLEVAMRRGEKFDRPPRIRIGSIHSVKGGEAEHVAMVTDLSTKVDEAMEIDDQDEIRTFYVGATRAKESLNIIAPRTRRSFQI